MMHERHGALLEDVAREQWKQAGLSVTGLGHAYASAMVHEAAFIVAAHEGVEQMLTFGAHERYTEISKAYARGDISFNDASQGVWDASVQAAEMAAVARGGGEIGEAAGGALGGSAARSVGLAPGSALSRFVVGGLAGAGGVTGQSLATQGRLPSATELRVAIPSVLLGGALAAHEAAGGGGGTRLETQQPSGGSESGALSKAMQATRVGEGPPGEHAAQAPAAPLETTLVPGAEGLFEFTPEHFAKPPEVSATAGREGGSREYEPEHFAKPLEVSATAGREGGSREYEPEHFAKPPEVSATASREGGSREYNREHFAQPVDVGPRGSGSPGTGPTGVSEARSGINFNLYNEAEVALGGRWDYDPRMNVLRSVEFDVPRAVGNVGTRPERFGQEQTMTEIGIRQPSHEAFTGSGKERGHGAAQQLSAGNPDVAGALMRMSNVWAMEGLGATGVNQGAFKAAEDHYIAVKAANPEADIRVRIDAELGSPPKTFTPSQGLPTPVVVPEAFVMTIFVTPPGGRPLQVQRIRVENIAGRPPPPMPMPTIPN
jgi:hypothetical protein